MTCISPPAYKSGLNRVTRLEKPQVLSEEEVQEGVLALIFTVIFFQAPGQGW